MFYNIICLYIHIFGANLQQLFEIRKVFGIKIYFVRKNAVLLA